MNGKYVVAIILGMCIILGVLYAFGGKKVEHAEFTNNGYALDTDEYIKPVVVSNLLSQEECELIKNHCADKLEESMIVSGKDYSIRNSKQTWIGKRDDVIKPIIDKIINMVQLPLDNAEDLQVVKYGPDQYYNEHHDSCCDDNEACTTFVQRGGQRVLTVLIYLSDQFEGGHTFFKNLDLKVKPNVGDAIIFHPLAVGTNKCHPLALHAGMPVTSGEKWIANLWFREKTFT